MRVTVPIGTNDDLKTAPTDERSASHAATAIEHEIARYNATWPPTWHAARLRFASAMEIRFEIETGTARLREIRITALLSIVFYYLTTITDLVFVPDLGWTAFLWRLPALPLSIVLLCTDISGRRREIVVTASTTLAIIILGRIPGMSAAPLAPYAFGMAVLGLIYANVTYPLRFSYACVFTAGCMTDVVIQIGWNETIDIGLRYALILQLAIGASFSLITSYRIERSTRLKYLLGASEALRLTRLTADREMLAIMSNTDGLTGIANRGYFDQRSAALLADPAHVGTGIGLLMLDVDYFKRYNDRYGHAAGDKCLRRVAAALADGFRGKHDIVARYGGEEFTVLLVDVTAAQVQAAAARICEVIARLGIAHADRDDGVSIVTVSVGAATTSVSVSEGTMDALIEAADRALYAAKRGGRNRFESSMQLVA